MWLNVAALLEAQALVMEEGRIDLLRSYPNSRAGGRRRRERWRGVEVGSEETGGERKSLRVLPILGEVRSRWYCLYCQDDAHVARSSRAHDHALIRSPAVINSSVFKEARKAAGGGGGGGGAKRPAAPGASGRKRSAYVLDSDDDDDDGAA